MPSLEEQLRKFAGKAKDKLETVTRMVALQMAARMIDRSPVDTGRFRGAWVYGSGAAPNLTDKAGTAATERIQADLQGWRPGEAILISNSLPYAYRLEHGWSQQAPGGMVRVTVAEYQTYISKAIASVK